MSPTNGGSNTPNGMDKTTDEHVAMQIPPSESQDNQILRMQAQTDWLNGPVDKSSVLSQEEVSQLNVEFNYHNYWQIFDRKEPAEEDLSEDFKSHYEDWLQEHVWGYYE